MLENFSPYKKVLSIGVRLPDVKIEQRFYDELNLSNKTSNHDFLRRLCWKGIKEKGIDKYANAKEYYERVKYELDTFQELGFNEYMLLNWEILNFCREKNIPTNAGRGSAGSSLVLSLIGVTKIDPFEYKLFFERFVSKSRAKKIIDDDGTVYLDGSLVPDVDNDIDYSRRSEVMKFIEERHEGKTCKILTLNTLSGKLCMKECLKIAEGKSEDIANDVSESIPKKFGKVLDFEDAIKESEKFAAYVKEYPKAFLIAQKLEGLVKNTGVHPSGIAICHDLLDDTMPYGLTKDGELISGFEMNDVASVAIKFDILGLRTLTVLDDVCKMTGLDLEKIDKDDKETYDFLQNLVAPQGLFQIETDTGFGVCKKVRPKNIHDLSAVLALARPGALAFADQYAKFSNTGESSSIHPFFDDVLGWTGSIPLYQEQLIAMARKIGFTADEGEQLRRIVGKKKVEQMKEWKGKIADKIKENKLDEKIGEILWKVAEDSANYSFNASHSYCYGICSYYTAYCKVHYPQEFFLALLRMSQHEPDSFLEISKITQELPLFNIRLLPPDLIKSENDFSIEDKDLRFGLQSIKGISEKTSKPLDLFRMKSCGNKFEIFYEAKEAGLNIGNLCALIQAGCLDSFNTERSLLVLEAQIFNKLTPKEKLLTLSYGAAFNFDILKLLKAVGENKVLNDKGKSIINEKRLETLRKNYQSYRELYDHNCQHQKFCHWFFERKLLGYSYSQTLRDVFKDPKEKFAPIIELVSLLDRDDVCVVGVATEFKKAKSKKNDKSYLNVSLSDETGKTTLLFFDKETLSSKVEPQQERHPMSFWMKQNKLKEDDILMIKGKKSGDIVFVDSMRIVDTEIFLKTSQMKD